MSNVQDYIEKFFNEKGIDSNSLAGRIKRRNIRIQLCLKGFDMDKLEKVSFSDKETISKVSEVLKSMNI